MKVLEVTDLSVRYQGAEVLSGLTFDIEQGDYVGIVGPNGSGKTTLIRCSLGLVPASAGTIRLFGLSHDRFSDWHKIGYAPQASESRHQGFPATVAEIVATGLLSRKRFPKRFRRQDHDAVDQALALLGIEDLKRNMITQLSGGQRHRVLLARALVADPELLLLDEPTAAVDPTTRGRFYEMLEALNRKARKTILIVTHDLGTVGQYAAKLLYLDQRLVFFGSFEQFCRSDRMAEYFGQNTQHLMCHQHDQHVRAR